MSLTGIAKETLQIIETGSYVGPSGLKVSLKAEIDRAVKGTVLYRPQDKLDSTEFDRNKLDSNGIANSGSPTQEKHSTRIEVTNETTTTVARRLIFAEGLRNIVGLSFASAKNPGGGFLGGAKAQEEDLARASALYACLLTQKDYYDANREHDSLLYTDHIIYSPEVPFFREDGRRLLDIPFLLSIITAPAPNAGEVLRRDPQAEAQIHETLERRAGRVLAIASAHRHKVLILGAWGCGVFRNHPFDVANVFAEHLLSDKFRQAFELVVFAVYDPSPSQKTWLAFNERFTRQK